MFVHSADIPFSIAMAIWRVMHNRVIADDWELFDRYPREQILAWIESILQDNGTERIDEETKWWSTELKKPDN